MPWLNIHFAASSCAPIRLRIFEIEDRESRVELQVRITSIKARVHAQPLPASLSMYSRQIWSVCMMA